MVLVVLGFSCLDDCVMTKIMTVEIAEFGRHDRKDIDDDDDDVDSDYDGKNCRVQKTSCRRR